MGGAIGGGAFMEQIISLAITNAPNFIGFALLAFILNRQIEALRRDLAESNKFMQSVILLLLKDSDVPDALQSIAREAQPLVNKEP